jgi:SAM-dependent methyltransferase
MIDESIQETVKQIVKVTTIAQKHILEVGCGDGRITKFLARESNNVCAIEPDSSKVAIAKQSIPNANIQVGSGENLQFLDNLFDLVIFTLSLHHHQDRCQALDEAYRVTKPGGIIIIIEPVADGELEIVFSFVNDEEEVLSKTQGIIAESGLNISNDSIFTANWIFDDVNDLCFVLNSYYELEFDRHAKSKVLDFLGDKADHKPIILIDKLRTQVIRKMWKTL